MSLANKILPCIYREWLTNIYFLFNLYAQLFLVHIIHEWETYSVRLYYYWIYDKIYINLLNHVFLNILYLIMIWNNYKFEFRKKYSYWMDLNNMDNSISKNILYGSKKYVFYKQMWRVCEKFLLVFFSFYNGTYLR